jgi:hypothetical protein
MAERCRFRHESAALVSLKTQSKRFDNLGHGNPERDPRSGIQGGVQEGR